MKKVLSLLLVFTLLLSSVCLAETYNVLCLNCKIKGQTAIQASRADVYTAFAVLNTGEAVLEWHINGKTVLGQRESYLTFSISGDMVVEAIIGTVEENAYLKKEDEQNAREKVVITAIGAKLQYLDKSGSGSGENFETIDFTRDYINPVTGKEVTGGTASFKITADYPHSDRIDYWVIDGVRYDFATTVKYITFTHVAHSMTIEVVYKNKKSQTNGNKAYMKAPAAGENLVVKTVNSKLRHVRSTATGNCPAMNEFDFTNDYKNLATGSMAKGGSINVKVYTTVSSNVKVHSWDFDEANLVFNTPITYMFVRGLNTSKTYTAHFDEENIITPDPTNPEERKNYCTVDCSSCTFSGGGYSGARKGDVPAGTNVNISSSIGACKWLINDVPYTVNGEEYVGSSISLTIRRWTRVRAIK